MVITTGQPIWFSAIYIYNSTFFHWFFGAHLCKGLWLFLQSFVFTTGLDIFLESWNKVPLCVSHLLSLMSFSYNAHYIIILSSYVCMSLCIYTCIYLVYPIIHSFNHIIKSWYIFVNIYICIYATYIVIIICNIDIHHIYALYIISYIHVLRCECIYKSEIYTSIVIHRFQKESCRRFDSTPAYWDGPIAAPRAAYTRPLFFQRKQTAKSS